MQPASVAVKVLELLLMVTVLFWGIVGLFVLPLLLGFIGPSACLAQAVQDSETVADIEATKLAPEKMVVSYVQQIYTVCKKSRHWQVLCNIWENRNVHWHDVGPKH